MRPVSVLLVILCAQFLMGCSDSSTLTDRQVRLDLVETFGKAGLDTMPAGPDVFADPASVSDLGDAILVLDRDLRQVVKLSIDGEVLAVGGRSGDGPGEFTLPINLAMKDDSTVSVLDYDNGRITFFDSESLEVKDVITGVPGRGFDHDWLGDTVWVVRPLSGEDSPIATAHIASNVEGIDVGPLPSAEDRGFGGGTRSARSDGRIVVGTARPGVWWEYTGGAWSRVGTPLFPDSSPPMEKEVAPNQIQLIPSPAASTFIDLVGDSLVLQVYVLWPGIQDAVDPFRSEIPRETRLGVFSTDGRFIGSAPLDHEVFCLATAANGDVLVCMWEPYPQVRRYRLSID